ncbi:MAG: SUMF1/EgtB/PvdO family nonheme iron enzyme [Tepidisphaerales bacterium]
MDSRALPRSHDRPFWLRYGAAAAYVAAAVAVCMGLKHFVGNPHPFTLFIPVVLAAAWYGGSGPAVMALVAAVLGMFLAAVGVDAREPTAQLQEAGAGGAVARDLTLDLGNGVTMKLVHIPAGKFLMGSPNDEKGRFDSETRHEVTISKPFYMGVTHVTVDQFAQFVKESQYQTDAEKDGWAVGFEIRYGKLDVRTIDGCSWRNPSFEQKGDHPVVQVSWNDANAFCDWLSKKSGKTVVLPTEAQWEYACRAGSKTAYPWGDNPDDGKGWANASDQSLKTKLPNAPADCSFFSWDDGFAFTSPVGSFKANPFGLYDMIGNARQWCQDRYGHYDAGAATDPRGANTGSLRVLRGGSWRSAPERCRSASRDWDGPGYRLDSYGFRVVVAAGVD